MKRLLRITAALTALLAVALQLPLAGAARACQAQMESHMAEMGQPASVMAGHAGAGSIASPAMAGMAESQSSEEEPPCGDDVDRDACIDMAACLSSLVIPVATTSATVHRVPAHVAMISASEPTSPFLPPEPPPPRV
jgi:hypothetical protein